MQTTCKRDMAEANMAHEGCSDCRGMRTLSQCKPHLHFAAQFPTLESWRDARPIGQDFHTGLWGFARHADGLNLNACRYDHYVAADEARTKSYVAAKADCNGAWAVSL